MNKRNLNQAIRAWLPLAAAITMVTGIAYVGIHQNYRQSANDPQIQMVSDTARAIKAGSVPELTGGIDPAFSLSPFMIIYNEAGEVVASNAMLAGKIPVLPKGVLDYAKAHGENRVTWQPVEGVRIAAVVQHISNDKGYVLAGRSLGEVEKREDMLTKATGAGLVLTLALTLGLFLVF